MFTVARNKDGEPLQLGETGKNEFRQLNALFLNCFKGKGRQKDSAIVRIQYQPIVQRVQRKVGERLQFDKADEDKDPSRDDSTNMQTLNGEFCSVLLCMHICALCMYAL